MAQQSKFLGPDHHIAAKAAPMDSHHLSPHLKLKWNGRQKYRMISVPSSVSFRHRPCSRCTTTFLPASSLPGDKAGGSVQMCQAIPSGADWREQVPGKEKEPGWGLSVIWGPQQADYGLPVQCPCCVKETYPPCQEAGPGAHRRSPSGAAPRGRGGHGALQGVWRNLPP